MKEWRKKIPKEIFGVWIASKEEIIKANRRAIELKENACFEEKILNSILANNTQQLVVPLLENDLSDDSKHIYRCIIWIKQSNENSRISTLIDIEESVIKSFIRPKEDELHTIIAMLVDQTERVNLDDYFQKINRQ